MAMKTDPATNSPSNSAAESPRLVFRIGFAGKANFEPKTDPNTGSAPTQVELEQRIRQRLTEVFNCMGETLAGIAPGTPYEQGQEPQVSRYFSPENPLLRIVTGLCEGCDQLAAEAQAKTDVLCPVADENGERSHDCLDTSLAAVIAFPFDAYRGSRPEGYRPVFDREAARCEYILELDGIYEKPDPNDASVSEGAIALASRRRARGYRAQAQVLLRHCDVLVAVADACDPGKAGGAMETMRSALEFNLPIVFVDLHTQAVTLLEPGEKVNSLLEDSIRSTAAWDERLGDWVTRIVADPDRDFLETHSAPEANADAEPTDAFLDAIFRRQDLPPQKPAFRDRTWTRFSARIKRRAKPSVISGLGGDDGIEAAIDRKFSMNSPFAAWRNRARYLNYHFSGLYRGAFLLNFSMAVAAVLLAALSLVMLAIFGGSGGSGDGVHTEAAEQLKAGASAVVAKAAAPAQDEDSDQDHVAGDAHSGDGSGKAASGDEAEDAGHGEHHGGEMPRWLIWVLGVLGALKLAIVIFIAHNTQQANSQQWNDLAINTRYLAERLRALFYLPLAGSFQTPAVRQTQYTSRVLSQSSVDWLFDAFTRSVSPAAFAEVEMRTLTWTDADSPGKTHERQTPFLAVDAEKAAAALRDQWLGEQICYHDKNARTMGYLHHRLERVAERMSLAVIVFVVLDVLIVVADLLGVLSTSLAHSLHGATPWLVFLAALLPAAVAALNGIRFQSECQRLAERSAVMRTLLIGARMKVENAGLWKKADELQREIAAAKAAADDPAAWTGEVLQLSEAAARDFVEEAAEWSVLYAKELPDPG